MTKTYGVALRDAFGKWISPLSGGKTRKCAREMAHYYLVEGWHNLYGEITAVQVVEWNGYDATRELVKTL